MRLEIAPGDTSWGLAAPLFQAVWPPEFVATSPWAEVVWAHAERRVLVRNERDEIVCHVGIYSRDAVWDGRAVRIGGIGGVITRQDSRRRGFAGGAIQAAIAEMNDVDFVLLFCEPHNFAFYRGLGWHPFAGAVVIEQPRGRVRFEALTPFVFDIRLAPRSGTIDLRGQPC